MHWSKLEFILRHGQCTHRGEGQPYAGENSDLSGDMASVKGGQTKARGFAPTARQQRAVFGSAQRHCWVRRGVHALTLSSTNPGQGVEVDGAPGSTTVGVVEGDGTPAACRNNREGEKAAPTENTGGKILLNGCPL